MRSEYPRLDVPGRRLPSLLSDMEQILNLKFVSEVEKRPVLYNYRLKGYSKRDVTETAWNEVGKEVNLTVNECKEKWKNLRSVFVRHMKPNGSGTKNKKPYYLAEAMQFTLPFIKTLAIQAGNFLSNSYQTAADPEHDSAVPTEQDDLADEEESSESLVHDLPFSYLSTTLSPTTSIKKEETDLSHEMPIDTTNRKAQKRASTDVDNSLAEYLHTKTKKLCNCNTPNEEVREKDHKKMFLLSLLPEIEPMTNTQMKLFRRRVLQLIDDIISPAS